MHFLSKEIADRMYEFYLSHKLLVCFLSSENRILFQCKISLPLMSLIFFWYLAQWIQNHFETTNSNFCTISELWIHSFGIGFWIRWARQWSDFLTKKSPFFLQKPPVGFFSTWTQRTSWCERKAIAFLTSTSSYPQLGAQWASSLDSLFIRL